MPEHRPSSGNRLHPAAIAVWILELAGRGILGSVALIVLDRRWAFLLFALLALGAVSSFIRYLRFAYEIEGNALIVEGGFLNTWRRVIPLPRIQSVDVVQKLRHRLFGVVELRIEAAGGRQTEAALVALRPEDAETLRAMLLSRAGPPPRPDEAPPVLVRLSPGQLLLAGITGGRVAVIAVLLGYLEDVISDEALQRAFERWGGSGRGGVLVVIGVVAIFLFLSLLISVVATLFVYWDFAVWREGDRLTITRGLFEKRRAVVPLRRLQAIRMDENLLRMLFGLVSLRAITAAHSGGSEEEQETSLLLPVGRRKEALRVISDLLALSAGEMVTRLEPVPARALAPRLAPGILLGLAAGLVGLAAFGAAGALGFLVLPGGVLLGWGSWRALGHSIDTGHAVVRSGVLVKRTLFVPLANLQHLSFTCTPVQRVLGLATVRVAIPRAWARATDLARARAAERFDLLARKMATGPEGPVAPASASPPG